MEVLGEWMDAGGFMMYVIAGLSVLGWVIFCERAYGLYLAQRLPTEAFIKRVVALVVARRFPDALDACNVKTKHPLIPVMRAGVLRADRRVKEIERGMENEMLRALPGLNKRIGFLALLANSATLLGLLGTIFGLISAFNSVKVASAIERQQELSNGISEAMYTTAAGIAVAVPLLFFHHFLSTRAENVTMEIERGATALIVALSGDASPPEAGVVATADSGDSKAIVTNPVQA